jgi:hypothetical protein
MKRFHPAAFALVLLTPALAVRLSAQAINPPPTPASASPAAPKEEPVVLSPFEVGPDSERGYQSTAILQGGRGKIDLADVAGQVQVFTKEFLDDLGATTTDEAFLFSATTQTSSTTSTATATRAPARATAPTTPAIPAASATSTRPGIIFALPSIPTPTTPSASAS